MAKITKRNRIHPRLRIGLYSILLICGGLLLGSIFWIFQRIHISFGAALAEVVVSVISILIFALIMVGMRAGLSLDRFIRHQKIDIGSIQKSLNQERQVLSWLGYEEINAKIPEPNIEQTLLMIDKPKRRGRPPTHSLERWTRVVLAWENRDPFRNPITLTEFLSQEFGTYADGTPCMSENSFYENRKKVFDELRKNPTLNKETTS